MVRAFWFRLGWLTLAAGMLSGCGKTPAAPAVATPAADAAPALPTRAQPELATIKLWLGAEEMSAEQALTEMQIRTGMMFRTNLADNSGMIFVLNEPQQASFWMKNCPLPLSAAYIDVNGKILELHDFQALDTNSVVSQAPNVEFVLETSQGWFARHHIGPGALVTTGQGTLKQVYLQ